MAKMGKTIGDILLVAVVGPFALICCVFEGLYNWLFPKPETPEEQKEAWRM